MPNPPYTGAGKSAVSGLKKICSYLLPLLCAAAVALYIGAVCSYDIAVEVSVDGTPVGLIESTDAFNAKRLSLEMRLSDAVGESYKLGCEISYSFVHAKDPVYLTESECDELLEAIAARDFTDAYMLYVDDVPAAANEDYDSLYSLISEIEADLLASGGDEFSRVVISNRLRIVEQPCYNSYLMSVDEINALLNPLAQEQQEAAAAYAAAEPEDSETATLRISAFMALSPDEYDDESELIDPDVDYGLVRQSDSDEESAPDLTLSYELIRTETVTETVYHKTQYIDDYDNFIGTNTVIQEGADGLRTVTYEISCDGEGNELGRVELESIVLIPVEDRIVMVGSTEIPDAVPTGTFIWPCVLESGISSGYGGRDLYGSYDFHLGIDIPGDNGTPIYASDGGEVIWAGFTPSYGYSVRIQHNDEFITLYAHMQKMLVKVGDMVYQGQQIGEMGHTGAAYGTHLHFEVRIGSLTKDPMKYLPKLED